MKIPDRQDALESFHREHLADKPEPRVKGNGHPPPASVPDELIIKKARGADNGDKFERLCGGDLSDYGGDHSAADEGFTWMLWFWTQDPEQIKRIHGDSGLSRNKSTRRRDYLNRSIKNASESGMETYDWSKSAEYTRERLKASITADGAHSHSHSLGSTVNCESCENDLNHKIEGKIISFSGRDEPGPREWIVHNAVWKGYAACFFGEGGIAKSLLGLDLGLAVASEDRRYWHTLATRTVPVLYLDFELDADEQHRRLLELCAGLGLGEIPEDFYYMSAAGMSTADAFAVATEGCRELNIGLVVIDSVGFALDGDSELAKDVLGFYRRYIDPLTEAGATPLLVDHQAKIIKGEKYADKQAFGSVYKTNAARSVFQVRGEWDENTMTATFTHKKNNFGRKEDPFSLQITFEESSITVERLTRIVPDPDRKPSQRERVLEEIKRRERTHAEEIASATEIPLRSVQSRVSELIRDGAIIDMKERVEKHKIVCALPSNDVHSFTDNLVNVNVKQDDPDTPDYDEEEF